MDRDRMDQILALIGGIADGQATEYYKRQMKNGVLDLDRLVHHSLQGHGLAYRPPLHCELYDLLLKALVEETKETVDQLNAAGYTVTHVEEPNPGVPFPNTLLEYYKIRTKIGEFAIMMPQRPGSLWTPRVSPTTTTKEVNMTQVANPSRVTVEAAIAAYNSLVQEPLVRAFVTEDGYIDLPLIFDHTDVIRPLISPSLYDTLQNSFYMLVEFLFPDIPGQDPAFCEDNAQALRYQLINGELTTTLRHYESSEMYVLASTAGKIVIG